MGRGLAGRAGLGGGLGAFQQNQPQRLTMAERAEIEVLASSAEGLVLTADRGSREASDRAFALGTGGRLGSASSQELTVHLHWSLGTVTEHRVKRSVRSWDQLASAAAVHQLLQAGQAAGWPSRRMAAELNAAGYQTPRGKLFTAESVRQLLVRGGPRRAAGRSEQADEARLTGA